MDSQKQRTKEKTKAGKGRSQTSSVLFRHEQNKAYPTHKHSTKHK